MLLNVIGRPGDALRGDAAPAHRQPRGPRRASAGTSAGRSRSTGRCSPPAWSSGCDEPDDDGPHRPAHRRPAARLRAQPAAVAVRAGRDRAARPGVADVRARRASPSSSPPWTTRGQVLSAQQFKARGEAVAADEGRRHRVRGADGAARGRHLPQAAGRAARRRATRSYRRGPPVGRRPRAVARSRSSATCTSGR